MKSIIVWGITLNGLHRVISQKMILFKKPLFASYFVLVSFLAYSSTLKMATCSSVKLVDFIPQKTEPFTTTSV
jgi:hypothetical protein